MSFTRCRRRVRDHSSAHHYCSPGKRPANSKPVRVMCASISHRTWRVTASRAADRTVAAARRFPGSQSAHIGDSPCRWRRAVVSFGEGACSTPVRYRLSVLTLLSIVKFTPLAAPTFGNGAKLGGTE